MVFMPSPTLFCNSQAKPPTCAFEAATGATSAAAALGTSPRQLLHRLLGKFTRVLTCSPKPKPTLRCTGAEDSQHTKGDVLRDNTPCSVDVLYKVL